MAIFLFNTNLFAKDHRYRDVFVYKVAETVYSLKDLHKYYSAVQSLKCAYPRGILAQVFKDEFRIQYKGLYSLPKKTSGSFSIDQKNYYLRLIEFSKMINYSKGHSDNFTKPFIKAIQIHSIKNKCLAKNKGSYLKTREFQAVVKLESFFRSRFLPQEKDGQETQDDIIKSIESIRNFVKSINKQIDQEVYW